MVGSIGSGQSFAAFSASRAFASPAGGQAESGQNSANGAGKSGSSQELTESEEKQVRELKKRDAEVRAHEQAHARVGGSYASAPTYEFQAGPDGKSYAVGGEVQIDAAPIPGKPEATIRKLDIVIRAALAPSEPSSQDLQVAATARENKIKAQAEVRAQKQEGLQSDEPESPGSSDPPSKSTNSDGLLSLLKAQESAQEEPSAISSAAQTTGALQTNAVDAIQAYRNRILQQDQVQTQGGIFSAFAAPSTQQSANSAEDFTRFA